MPLACGSSDRLLIALGVTTRPALLDEVKDVISRTWARDAPPAAYVCFVVARHLHVWSTWQEPIHTGAAASEGVLLVNATPDASGSQVQQVSFGWWSIASQQFPRAAFLAKVDDDTYVSLPRLVHLLLSARSEDEYYLGHFRSVASCNASGAGIGDVPHQGWALDSSEHPRLYWRRHCSGIASSRPLLTFALGPLYVLTARLARWLAHDSHAVRARAHLMWLCSRWVLNLSRPRTHDYCLGEDLAIGKTVREAPFRVRHLELGSRRVHDLRCWEPPGSPGRVPDNESVAVHRIKQPRGHEYVHAFFAPEGAPSRRLARGGEQPIGGELIADEATRCAQLAWNESRAHHNATLASKGLLAAWIAARVKRQRSPSSARSPRRRHRRRPSRRD